MGGKKANICIECENACGGCSWSAVDPVTGKLRFEPVPGWEAEEVPIVLGVYGKGIKKVDKTYHITACPQFVKARQKTRNTRELSVEESNGFLENVERILKRWDDGRD